MFLADSHCVRPPSPIEKNCLTGEWGSQAIIPVGLAMFRLRDLLWHKNYQFPWAWDPWCDLAQRALWKETWWQLGGQPDLSSELEVENVERISREEKSKKMPRQAEAECSRTTGKAEHRAKRRWVLLLVCLEMCVCEGGWRSKQPSWPLLGFVRPGFPSLLLSLWSLMSQLFLSFLKTQLSAEIPIGSTWVSTPQCMLTKEIKCLTN